MNYTLQLHGERHLYQVPPGLYELMSDISREVLRDQPSFLYKYIAHYLETLIKVRKYSEVAEGVVKDSLNENMEMLAYIDSLGTTWEAATSAAKKIQSATRKYHSKKLLKLRLEVENEKKIAAKYYLQSKDFQDFVETLSLDLDDSSKASTLLLDAYKQFIGKKEEVEEVRSEVSIHTIEGIFPKVSKEVKRDRAKRDPTLMVYQQSPKHSVESSWSILARQLAEEEKRKAVQIRPNILVYEGDVDVTSLENIPPVTKRLPGYHDEHQFKVPMIADTGELSEDKDIFTLFSEDSIENQYFPMSDALADSSFSNISIPSLDEEKSRELFDVLERRYSKLKNASEMSIAKDAKDIEAKASERIRGSRTSIKKQSIVFAQSVSEDIQTHEEGRVSQSSIKRESKSSVKIESKNGQDSGEIRGSRTSINRGSHSSAKIESERIHTSEQDRGSRSSINRGSHSSTKIESELIHTPEQDRGSQSSIKKETESEQIQG